MTFGLIAVAAEVFIISPNEAEIPVKSIAGQQKWIVLFTRSSNACLPMNDERRRRYPFILANHFEARPSGGIKTYGAPSWPIRSWPLTKATKEC